MPVNHRMCHRNFETVESNVRGILQKLNTENQTFGIFKRQHVSLCLAFVNTAVGRFRNVQCVALPGLRPGMPRSPAGAAGLQTLHTKLPYITPSMTISSNK